MQLTLPLGLTLCPETTPTTPWTGVFTQSLHYEINTQTATHTHGLILPPNSLHSFSERMKASRMIDEAPWLNCTL